ncbi:hypothetical protein TYRP_021927 [Tyrophagus putrescentiae]|nr:hypothetical protein TYRP_021927 [Tyrophagus putrescentiae]
MKLSTLSKKLSTKRWRSKGSKGPLTLTSISLAGSCFEEERQRVQKSAHQHITISGSLTSSLASMYSSELELEGGSVGGCSHGSGSTSRSSSMITTSSVSSADSTDSPPSWSEAYMPYLDEDDDDDDMQCANERTLFMGKNSLAATRPVAV